MSRILLVLLVSLAVLACRRAPGPAPVLPADSGPVAVPDAGPPPAPPVEPPAPAAVLPSKADPAEARKVLDGLRTLAERGEVSAMTPFFFGKSASWLARKRADDVKVVLGGTVTGADVNGGRVLLKLSGNPKAKYAAFFVTSNGYKYDPQASLTYRDTDAGPRVPENRDVPLAEALKGVPGTGLLTATIRTTKGDFTCRLFEDKVPKTVANFVALATGKRGWRDSTTGKWVKRPFFNGLTFHRVLPKFMVQGGCPKGDGSGDPGYSLADEFDLSLRHDAGGRLSMANAGPNTNGSQFFITEIATPWLDDHHSIFGQCDPLDLVKDMARVATDGSKPVVPIKITEITFARRAP